MFQTTKPAISRVKNLHAERLTPPHAVRVRVEAFAHVNCAWGTDTGATFLDRKWRDRRFACVQDEQERSRPLQKAHLMPPSKLRMSRDAH